ncbi:MAG TPA: HTH domain-containing protein [Kofleriaceae bacterium]|nr:HTH domain-containing protein [Kofleriaceae bacterium]
MSTLAVVEEILRETAVPMSVREIVVRAGARLPSKSKTPDTVVARDLAMDIKRKGDGSLFTRTSPGRYTLRALASAAAPPVTATVPTTVTPPVAPTLPPPVPATAGALERGRAPALAASKRERGTDSASQAG